MAQSAPQVFSGITPENYATLIQKAQSAGLNLSGNSGTATKFGVEDVLELLRRDPAAHHPMPRHSLLRQA